MVDPFKPRPNKPNRPPSERLESPRFGGSHPNHPSSHRPGSDRLPSQGSASQRPTRRAPHAPGSGRFPFGTPTPTPHKSKPEQAASSLDSLETISSLFRQFGHLDQKGFLALFNHPVLLQKARQQHEDSGKAHFRTMSSKDSSLIDTSDTFKAPLFKVTKQGSNTFGNMVTVGRAKNNDIVLPSSMVSKFHAYFSNKGGQWYLTDSGSSNGTFVNSQRLSKNQAVPVNDSDTIAFGDALVFSFTRPSRLYHYINYVRNIQS